MGLISFLFRVRDVERPNVYIRVYAGAKRGARAFCGGLTLRREEWAALRPHLATIPYLDIEDEAPPSAAAAREEDSA